LLRKHFDYVCHKVIRAKSKLVTTMHLMIALLVLEFWVESGLDPCLRERGIIVHVHGEARGPCEQR
jgi:hypothetical protein